MHVLMRTNSLIPTLTEDKLEKLKELDIETRGFHLIVEMVFDEGDYKGKITGERVQMAPIKVPGKKDATLVEDKIDPIEISRDTENDLVEAINQRIESEFGTIIPSRDKS